MNRPEWNACPAGQSMAAPSFLTMKSALKRFRSPVVLLVALLLPTWLSAQADPPAPSKFLDSVRFQDKADGHAELQTAIVSFQNPSGCTVDLVSAVHIGDPQYFRQLNQHLASYDAVLYEMVGGPVETRGENEAAPEVGMTHLLQRVVQSMLGLKYQLDGIDYNRPNFVHADATWQQWEELMAAKNQSMASLFLRALEMQDSEEVKKVMESMKGEEAMTSLVTAITKFNPEKFKRALAPLLSESEGFIQTLEGQDGTVLISERNKIVMGALQDEIAKGKKRIAVFYGAGHMPDFKQRLEAAGFAERRTEWLTAWNIGDGDKTLSGLDLMENVLKDDAVIEGVISFFRQVAGEGQNGMETGSKQPAPPPHP